MLVTIHLSLFTIPLTPIKSNIIQFYKYEAKSSRIIAVFFGYFKKFISNGILPCSRLKSFRLTYKGAGKPAFA